MAYVSYPSVMDYLNDVVKDLQQSAPRNTGRLANSIEAELTDSSTGYEAEISMLNYGLYQDKGVNGIEKSYGSPYSFSSKRPPSGAFKAYRGFEFAIAYSIWKNGLKPKNWIQPSLDRTMDGLADVTAQDLWNYFLEQNTDNTNT